MFQYDRIPGTLKILYHFLKTCNQIIKQAQIEVYLEQRAVLVPQVKIHSLTQYRVTSVEMEPVVISKDGSVPDFLDAIMFPLEIFR